MGELLVAAAVLGLIPAAIARHKGDSFLWWWLVGTVMLIVALPWVLLMKDKRRRCPHCAETVRTQARVCPHCQRDLALLSKGSPREA